MSSDAKDPRSRTMEDILCSPRSVMESMERLDQDFRARAFRDDPDGEHSTALDLMIVGMACKRDATTRQDG